MKSSFVMKTLYLDLTSYFDLIRFNGSANGSELTVFFCRVRYLKIRRTCMYLLSLLNKNFPQNFLSPECNINLAPFRPSFITIIIIFFWPPATWGVPEADRYNFKTVHDTVQNHTIMYPSFTKTENFEFIGRIQIPTIFLLRAKKKSNNKESAVWQNQQVVLLIHWCDDEFIVIKEVSRTICSLGSAILNSWLNALKFI